MFITSAPAIIAYIIPAAPTALVAFGLGNFLSNQSVKKAPAVQLRQRIAEDGVAAVAKNKGHGSKELGYFFNIHFAILLYFTDR